MATIISFNGGQRFPVGRAEYEGSQKGRFADGALLCRVLYQLFCALEFQRRAGGYDRRRRFYQIGRRADRHVPVCDVRCGADPEPHVRGSLFAPARHSGGARADRTLQRRYAVCARRLAVCPDLGRKRFCAGAVVAADRAPYVPLSRRRRLCKGLRARHNVQSAGNRLSLSRRPRADHRLGLEKRLFSLRGVIRCDRPRLVGGDAGVSEKSPSGRSRGRSGALAGGSALL